jgi:hypothetical protein
MNHARKWATRTFYGTLLAGVAVVAAGCGADDSAASTSASAQSASSMVDDAESRTADEVGTAPRSASSGEVLHTWWSDGAIDKYMAIASDATDVSTAAFDYDIPGVVDACMAMQRDVETAQAYAPAPVESVREPLSEALALYARAATNCVAGARTINDSLLSQAASEIEQATAKIGEATAAIEAMSGS